MKPIDTLTDLEFAELVDRAARLPEAPPAAVQAAIDLWPSSSPHSTVSLAESAARIVHAILSFDSWARPGFALGMRSARSDKRHLLFSAGERDVDLRINPEDGAFYIMGQILGPDEAGSVELSPDAGSPAVEAGASNDERANGGWVARLDELGEFRLNGIRPGTYRLTLHLGSDAVVVYPIVVGAEPG